MSAKLNRRLFVSDEYTENLLEKLYREHGLSASLAIRMGIQVLTKQYEFEKTLKVIEKDPLVFTHLKNEHETSNG